MLGPRRRLLGSGGDEVDPRDLLVWDQLFFVSRRENGWRMKVWEMVALRIRA